MPDQNSWITLRSAALSAQIDPVGAQLSVLQDAAGRDLLWNGDPTVWSGRAPLLFPIIGELADGRFRLGGHEYRLSRHGFARGKTFEVIQTDGAQATFRLRADDSTLAAYPFQFELDVQFALAGPTLTVTTTVRNLGDASMPASFGYHPGFRWPLPYGQPRDAHYIEFETAEPEPVRRLDAKGLVTPDRLPTPVSGARLTLQDALFAHDALIFDKLRSRSVTYGAAAGPRLRVSFPDSPYLGVWTKPGAPFICIEPWNGMADPVGFSSDFRTKPGIFSVAQRSTRTIEMAVTLLS